MSYVRNIITVNSRPPKNAKLLHYHKITPIIKLWYSNCIHTRRRSRVNNDLNYQVKRGYGNSIYRLEINCMIQQKPSSNLISLNARILVHYYEVHQNIIIHLCTFMSKFFIFMIKKYAGFLFNHAFIPNYT